MYSKVLTTSDNGKDLISTVLGNCLKIFLMFPPTTNNLRAHESADIEPCRFAAISRKLEGGLYTELTSSSAFILPSGTLHYVKTIVGGTLVSKDFCTTGTLASMSRWIATSKSFMDRISLDGRESLSILES